MLSYVRQHISFKYSLLLGGTIAAVFVALFFWISHKQGKYILAQVEKQAMILHRQIVLTRQWASDHNYILVAKKEGAFSDYVMDRPALENVHGTAYTRITPAALTRRLSDYAAQSDMYSFNLTNPNGINPANKPDDFEMHAIEMFRAGNATGISRMEMRQGRHVFRYAAPLVVRESCLACHNSSQYRVGGIGGCISVLIPCDEAVRAIKSEKFSLFAGMAGLTVSVILVLLFSTQRLIFKPIKEIRKITAKIRCEAFKEEPQTSGDELREFAGLCYKIDEKLKHQHQELEKNIADATREFQSTTRKMELINKELLSLNQAKNDFFSDISHELRTPLTSIKGAADTLSRKDSCSDPVYLQIIKKNADHLHRTISDFLDYAKIEGGRLELEYQAASLRHLVEDAIVAQQADAARKNISLEIRRNSDITLQMDPHRIYQVVSNLISNAIKFSPENTRIILDVEEIGDRAHVSVTDQGPGIPEACHQAVFKKFYQVSQNGEQRINQGSSGIGLAICKGLLEAHGGKIWVENIPGNGCRFTFAIPMEIKDCVEGPRFEGA